MDNRTLQKNVLHKTAHLSAKKGDNTLRGNLTRKYEALGRSIRRLFCVVAYALQMDVKHCLRVVLRPRVASFPKFRGIRLPQAYGNPTI